VSSRIRRGQSTEVGLSSWLLLLLLVKLLYPRGDVLLLSKQLRELLLLLWRHVWRHVEYV
jgi:hypothetical protein